MMMECGPGSKLKTSHLKNHISKVSKMNQTAPNQGNPILSIV